MVINNNNMKNNHVLGSSRRRPRQNFVCLRPATLQFSRSSHLNFLLHIHIDTQDIHIRKINMWKLTLEQAMKAKRGSRGIAWLFFNLGA